MLEALRRLFRVTPPAPLPPPEGLEDALRRLRKLEGEQLEMLTEWVRTRDSLARNMKRLGAVKQRIDAADDDDEDDDDREVLRLKLGGK